MNRVLYLLPIALASGCQFTGLPGGDPDASGGDDVADAPPGTPDAAVIDAMNEVDTDGDGAVDSADNCPTTANGDQANEDLDDRGDACDLCPHLSGTVPGTDADGDADGIGDQCDPRVGADRLVVFLGFNTATDLAAFSVRAGSNQWSISGGRLHQDDTATGAAQQTVWTGESIAGTVVVDTEVHIDDVPSPGTAGPRIAGVVGAHWDGSPVDVYACGLRAPAANGAISLAAWHLVNPPAVDVTTTTAFTGTMSIGAQARVQLTATDQVSDSTLDCRADTTPLGLSVPGYIPEGYPGFRTIGTLASYGYLFVVDVGP